MSEWSPSPVTRKEIDWLVEDLFSVAPEVLGIDETITGCDVVNLDPYGVGVATLPRYILVSLRGRYHQDVFYRGGFPDLAIGDYLTVIHEREGNRYEVMGPGGSAGVIPDPAPVGAEYVVMTLDPVLTNERVLVARQWLGLTDGGAGGDVTLDFTPDNPARVQSTGVITEYATIQAAINASAGGDWVAVPPGTYVEALTLKDGVPVTELFRHTVTIRQTAGTYTVQTTGTGTFLICVHRIEMDRAFETNTGIFAVYANHAAGVFTIIADLYCRNSITIVNGCALGLGNWNTGSVDHTGDIECISNGYYFGCYAVRNDSTGTILGRGDIIANATDGFAYGARNNSTGVLRWWGDIDVDTLGADPAVHFAIGIRTRGGTTEWHGYMDVWSDNTGAKGLYASNGAGTAYLEGRIEVWGLDDSSYGIFMGDASACTTVITFRGILDITNYDHDAYGSHTDPTYGDGTIWLHADVYVDGYDVVRGVSQEGSGTTWHQDGGIDTISGLPMHDLYRSAGTLNVSNSRYDRGKTFGTITEMDGDKVGHHKLASVAVNEGASLVGIQDVGAFYIATDVEGALQEIGAIAPVGGAGSGAANRIAYWSDANTITSDAGLLVDAANDMLIVADAGGIGNLAATARLMFDSSGVIDYAYFQDCDVGIGISSPGGALHIYKDVNTFLPVIIENPNAGAGAEALFALRNGPTFGDALRLEVLGTGYTTAGAFVQDGGVLCTDVWLSGGLSIMTRAAAPIRFYTSGHATERMRIEAGGCVAIGITSASAQLHVDQPSASGAIPVLMLDQGDVSEQCILFSSDSVDRDINLFTLDVTADPALGVPRMWWDESDDVLMWTHHADIAGHIAIGGAATISASHVMSVAETTTLLAGSFTGQYSTVNFNPGAGFTTNVYGNLFQTSMFSAQTRAGGAIYGMFGRTFVQAGIDARNLVLTGAQFATDAADAGSGGGVGALLATTFQCYTPLCNTGLVSWAYGLNISKGTLGAVAAGNRITNLYGLYIADMVDAKAGTSYSIYCAGGNSYHVGKVSIGGTVAPLAQLHVDQGSASGTIPVLCLDQGDVSEEMIEFACTIGVGNAIEAVGGKTLTTTHFIKISLPGALTRYIPVGTIA